MSSEQLKIIVEEVIRASGANSIKDMGRVMKDVLARVKGQADNQTGWCFSQRTFNSVPKRRCMRILKRILLVLLVGTIIGCLGFTFWLRDRYVVPILTYHHVGIPSAE